MINNWITIALICALLSSFGVILIKYIDNSKYDNIIFMIISYIIVGIFAILYFVYDLKNKKEILKKSDYKLILYSFVFACFIFIVNIIMQYAFSISPNISYTHLIINLNIIITIIASYILFKQNMNLSCLIGMIICLIGILIIILNYN